MLGKIRHSVSLSELLALMSLLLIGCTTTEVIEIEITGQGAYIVGYTDQSELRRAFEDQLVADLEKLDMRARASYPDFPSISGPSPEAVIQQAKDHGLAGIVIVNPVITDRAGPVTDPRRVTPEHRELRDFYGYTKGAIGHDYDPSREMFAEVNGYVINGDGTRLIWSGVTWTFKADGAGAAVSEVSKHIADNLVAARDDFLGR